MFRNGSKRLLLLRLEIGVLLLCAGFFLPVPAFAWEGRVVAVLDGDSLRVMSGWKTVVVRLYGIDTPESDQAFGDAAKSFTRRMVLNRRVSVEAVTEDKYERTVGIVSADGRCLNEELIRNGLAWHYVQYCHKAICESWKALEGEARAGRRGLWNQRKPVPPWEHRHEGKPPRGDKAGIGLLDLFRDYHGNVTSRVFHRSGCSHYDCKDCTARFSSRKEALGQGYKPCGLCRP